MANGKTIKKAEVSVHEYSTGRSHGTLQMSNVKTKSGLVLYCLLRHVFRLDNEKFSNHKMKLI